MTNSLSAIDIILHGNKTCQGETQWDGSSVLETQGDVKHKGEIHPWKTLEYNFCDSKTN
jgi:hypothetical protein